MNENHQPEQSTAGDVSLAYHQRFSVPFDYPVCFTANLFDPSGDLLVQVMDRLGEGRRHRAAVYIDSGVAAANPQLAATVKEYFHAKTTRIELAAAPMILPGGQAAKNGWESVRDVLWTLGNLHLDRQSFVIAVGGGSMLDMVGFACSLVHRGLRLIRVPTTVLAQNDAGIGVKNGMDEHGQKNFIGTFSPPFAVINDSSFLATLKGEDWSGGLAESFKVAIIKDAEFLDFLCDSAAALASRDAAAMDRAIRRTAVLHLEHIASGGDPFEMGSARPLDFGHWAGHKLEIMSAYRLHHGQAVSVGIALDSYYAMRTGLITRGDFEKIIRGMVACGLPIWTNELARRNADGLLEVLDGLTQFREHLGGRLCVTLPGPIGQKNELHQMNPDIIEEAVIELRKSGRGIEHEG